MQIFVFGGRKSDTATSKIFSSSASMEVWEIGSTSVISQTLTNNANVTARCGEVWGSGETIRPPTQNTVVRALMEVVLGAHY